VPLSGINIEEGCIPQRTVGHEDRLRGTHEDLRMGFSGRVRVSGSTLVTGVRVKYGVRSARDLVQSVVGKGYVTGLERHWEVGWVVKDWPSLRIEHFPVSIQLRPTDNTCAAFRLQIKRGDPLTLGAIIITVKVSVRVHYTYLHKTRCEGDGTIFCKLIALIKNSVFNG
jgi:hypothetical protein